MGLRYISMGLLPFAFLLLSIIVSRAIGDAAKDREDCAEQLAGLATCLPYVGGEAKSPTPDCCNGLKKLLQNNKKCLCVIVRDRNDPDLGLNINVTLALGLPSVCHASANVSQCPALLHLAPNSTEAQVFYQFANSSNASAASSPAPTSSAKGNSTSTVTSGNDQGTTAQVKSEGCCYYGNRWLGGLDVVVGGVLLWFFCMFF